MEISELVNRQRDYFNKGDTLSYKFRYEQLCRLEKGIKDMEKEIFDALYADLHKAPFESYMAEVGLTLSELTFVKKHLKKWMRKQRVHTPITQFPCKSFTFAEPYGVTLIMSPWNYPFMLTMEPLIGAIASGNTVVLKPSAYSKNTSDVIGKLISRIFDPSYIVSVEGGREANSLLLEQRFDYIFFTGSVNVGKLVMEKASRYLTPVSLELGGKSPCIIDKNTDIQLAAKRLVFGKFLNAGQTCVAPDYVIVHKDIEEELIKNVRYWIDNMYKGDALNDPDYPCIVNDKHFERILGLIDKDKVVYGGKFNKERRQIEPTVLKDVTLDDAVMKEEIFGPIMPILTYKTKEDLLKIIHSYEKPLALYLFTDDRKFEDYIISHVSYGGGCINDTIVHLATSNMGFGGVGYSGMGSYHGELSFKTFSHIKSVAERHNWLDLNIRYHPYSKKKEKILRKLMK
ncbi:MAG: aldehyde dehydrogenase [Bacilli bacterium]